MRDHNNRIDRMPQKLPLEKNPINPKCTNTNIQIYLAAFLIALFSMLAWILG